MVGIDRLGVLGEIIVVDNGSSDASACLASAAGAHVVTVSTRGYGVALRAGISCARGTFVVVADADASYDLAHLGAFWERLIDGSDLVVGNRFKGGIAAGAMPFWNRWIGNPFLSWCGRLFVPTRLGDFHCGLRAFRRTAIMDLGLRTEGMEFATEIIARACFAGLTVVEVPTHLLQSGRPGRSHLRPIRDSFRHLGVLIAISTSARAARRR
jgi:glycosyltransferase involved in cell wall biosynthesis